MSDKERFTLIKRPGATTFFTWLALSAAIFFGAYSVRVKDLYDKEVEANNTVMSRERELSYRLELASVKIKESVTTIEWSNVEINRLRNKNDEFKGKVVNMRKLLYAAVKKNQDRELATLRGEGEVEQVLTAVSPKVSAPLAIPEKDEVITVQTPEPIGQDILFPDLVDDTMKIEKKIEKIVAESSLLRDKSQGVVAEVLTYNSNSKKVYINIGRSNGGIIEGNRFAIWRNGKHVTDVRVAQVHSVTSTCEVISPVQIGLRAGDVAEMVGVSAF